MNKFNFIVFTYRYLNVQQLKMNGYKQTMDYLQIFVQISWQIQLDGTETNMPATALLTGINQPDHFQLFKTFAEGVRNLDNVRVCIIQSRDCLTMKSTIETMVSGLMEDTLDNTNNQGEGSDEDEDEVNILVV